MTDDKIIDGITKSLDNANSLFEEAKILQEHTKLERAYLLFQICLEETGKAHALFHLLLSEEFKDEIKLKIFLKNFRDHKFKIKQAINIDTITARLITDRKARRSFIETIGKQYKSVLQMNDLKNYSLYTSYFENQFLLPTVFIDEKLLGKIKFFAETRLLASKQLLPVFIRSLSTLRPIYQKECNSVTKEKLAEWTKQLIDGK